MRTYARPLAALPLSASTSKLISSMAMVIAISAYLLEFMGEALPSFLSPASG